MRALLTILGFCLLLASGAAFAIEPEEKLADPALEAKARAIAKQLRCVVCDNASIDDSGATVAQDMRKLVRKRVAEGKSEEEIKTEFVSSYGEYVLLQPRFSFSNLFVWLAAPLALLFGLYWIWQRTKPGSKKVPDHPTADAEDGPKAAPLSDEERRRLEEILKE